MKFVKKLGNVNFTFEKETDIVKGRRTPGQDVHLGLVLPL
jgi:hypothetical protein